MQSYCIIHPQSQLDSKFQYDSSQVKIEVVLVWQGWLVRMQFRLLSKDFLLTKGEVWICCGYLQLWPHVKLLSIVSSFELMSKFHHLSLHFIFG